MSAKATSMLKLAVVSTLSLWLCGCDTSQPAAELVLRNGDVRTMNDASPSASAFAVSAGKIVFIGTNEQAGRWIGPHTAVVDAGGLTVLPGLIDSHIHVAEGALSLGGCTLHNEQLTIEQAAAPIRACIAVDKSTTWIVVNEVNPAGFKATRRELDAIESRRPLFLWGADGHTAWVNSRALEVASITRTTPDPADGRIERDARGEPTGFLVDGATGLALSMMDKPTPEKRMEALRRVLPMLHTVGITSYLEANTDEPTVLAYAQFAKLGELTARVTVAFESSGESSPAEFERLEALRKQLAGNALFRADFIKLFADGVMEYPTQTAALLAPYNDAQGKPGKSTGKLYLTPESMAAFVTEAGKHSFNIHVHAIGDGAVRETLDVFEKARAAGSKQLFSIAHLQLIDAADLPRFAKLDVAASVQLLWAQPDNYSIDALTPWLDADRLARQYPARSLVEAGATIAGGSDWDVTTFNPFEAMATAMSRRHPEHAERPPLNPREALPLDAMLRAYTLGAAKLIGRDHEVGSLSTGKFADFIVLDRRLTAATTADDIRGTKPSRVFFGGRELTTEAR
ncbi:MAG TPA: amidohydrolase [Steroidobacteraceae bacterium]|nr:amidohydrolase [Steroidobacteraceae bacterium]